ncbi:MAG: glycosyltransferase family A protein [Halioglobus sp.]
MSFLRPNFSFIVIFHNMEREARRTLLSLTREYQNDSERFSYEVLAIDNGSDRPIQASEVESLGKQFSYHYFETSSPSPVNAINWAAKMAKGKHLCVSIDGARILSPGIFSFFDVAIRSFQLPFIYTLGMHLGPAIQNESIESGYNQSVEDGLLDSTGWEQDGYRLFDISSLAGSSSGGFFGPMAESNCFCLPKSLYMKVGGFNPEFKSPGGGLVNLDFFQKASCYIGVTPILLLGEATFHQVHGGVAANAPKNNHPMARFQTEYERIYSKPWEINSELKPVYLGKLSDGSKKFAFK